MSANDQWMSPPTAVADLNSDKGSDAESPEVKLMNLDDFLHGIGVHMTMESDASECESSAASTHYDFASDDGSQYRLTEADLKPQPIVRKSRKQLTPDEQKDERYWHKRAKNNFAAKRSRESRRQRENQIVIRANYLEKENASLKKMLKTLEDENKDLRKLLQRC